MKQIYSKSSLTLGTKFLSNTTKTLLILVSLLAFTINAWGKVNRTWKASVGVGVSSGKGTAKVEIYTKILGVESSEKNTTTTGSLKSISSSQSVYLSSSLINRCAKYSVSGIATGYHFDGWYSSSACSGSAASTSSSWQANSYTTNNWDVTYYAKILPNTYTIKFNGNGGSGSMSEHTCTYGVAWTLTANSFTREGYTFSGWNTKANGTGTAFTDKKSVTNITSENGATINLYAQWTANKYYVQFNGNGNSAGSMGKQTLTYDQSANLTANAFARSYTVTYDANGGSCAKSSETATYTFGGWAESATGEKKYNNQESVTNLTSTNGATINLYALWTNGTITLPAATKTGKVFDGWGIIAGTDTTYIGAKNANYDPTSNVTLKALWTDIASPKYNWNGAESKSYRVGDPALDLNELWVSNNEDTKNFELVSFTPSGTNNTGATAPTLADGILTLGQAGEVTVKVTQPASDYFYAGEAELTLTINKHENIILVKGVQSYRNEIDINSYDNGFTFAATNTDYANYPINVEQIAGQNIATYYPDQKVVYSGKMSGEAVWQVTQAESYYYEEGATTFAIDVRLAPQVACYLVDDPSTESWSTISNSKTYSFDRRGKVCTFQARRETILGFSNNNHYYAEYSSDGSNWTKALKLDLPNTDEWKDFSMNLPANARYVRFETETGATGTRKVRNVKVSRFTYLDLDSETLTFDKTNTDKPLYCGDELSKAFTIDWSMPENGTQINITSNNPKFTVSQAKIANTGCNDGTSTITVTYSSDVAGAFNGKITINNEVFYKEIAVSGATIKRDQTIEWTQAQDGYITTDAITLVATATSELDPTYTVVSGDDVATVDENGVVTVLKAGDVTFRASQAGDGCYNAAQYVDREFHIDLAPGSLTMNDGNVIVSTLEDVNTIDLSELKNAATDEGALSFEVISANKEHATLDENNFSADALGDYTIRATKAETDFYTSATAEFTVSVIEGVIFTGTNGNWGEEGNWSGDEVPGAGDRVIINANVELSEPFSVAGLTINEGKTVTIKDGGVLTVGDKQSITRDNYGNIIVEAGGQLNLTTGAVKVNDFTLYSGFEGGQPKSGQVDNAGKLHPNGHAYFVLDLDPAGQASQGWYGFTVPFQVNALTGLARSADGINWDTNLKNEVNYAIETYHEDLRAQGQNGWKKYTGIMQPGVHHLITVDCEINRYRFEMIQGGVFNTADKHALQATTIDGGNNIDKGWNGLGNGTMQYISLPDNKIVQVLVHKAKPDNSYYTSVLTDTCKFAVGAAYFYQAAANGEMSIISANGATIVRAPQRDYEEANRLFGLTLSQSGCKCDNLTISCDDEATDEYTIGKDVQKMGSITGTSIARLWTNAKGTNLCAVNKAYVNDQAIIPLSIYAPKTGEYTLSLNDAPADVYLTRNGIIVWNLSMSEYTFDLNAGTDDTYALQVVRRVQNVATGIDATNNNGTIFAEKMIVNGQLFILRDGVLYDAQGKKVSSK